MFLLSPCEIVLASAWQRHSTGHASIAAVLFSGLCEIGITTKGTNIFFITIGITSKGIEGGNPVRSKSGIRYFKLPHFTSFWPFLRCSDEAVAPHEWFYMAILLLWTYYRIRLRHSQLQGPWLHNSTWQRVCDLICREQFILDNVFLSQMKVISQTRN